MASQGPVKDYKCNNCGAPLVVPKNARKVTCPYCYTECTIENNIQNAEILNKENIAGGLPFSIEDVAVQKIVVDTVAKSECTPLDIYDNMRVLSLRKIYVPCFWFDNVNGMATCTYERGIDREQQVLRGSGDNLTATTKIVTEYTPQSFSSNYTTDFVVSGNKDYDSVITALYSGVENPPIIDIDELEYGEGVEMLSFNVPAGTAFNTNVRPAMENLLIENMARQLPADGKYRNVSYGGASVQRNEVKRIMVGIFHLVYEYAGTNYAIYISNDGQQTAWDKLPVDQARIALIQQKEAEKNALKPGTGLFTAMKIVGFILGGILLVVGLAADGGAKAAALIFGFLFIGCAIAGIVLASKKRKAYQSQVDAVQAEIDSIRNQIYSVKAQFEQSGRPLQGVFEQLIGYNNGFNDNYNNNYNNYNY